MFEAAYHARLPVLLKGPTGCGKTRFVEHMAWRLRPGGPQPANSWSPSPATRTSPPPTSSAATCSGDETVWIDGPLTRAVRTGAICYLDEIVEARKDTTVVIHPLTDHRRMLPIEKTGELLEAHADFLLVISYNPGYQSILKDLKPSTRQRFVSLEFDYPAADVEARSSRHEGGVDAELAARLAEIGWRVRGLREHGFEEGVSTRLLVYAAQLDDPRRRAPAGVRRRHRPGDQRRPRRPAGRRRRRRRRAPAMTRDATRPAHHSCSFIAAHGGATGMDRRASTTVAAGERRCSPRRCSTGRCASRSSPAGRHRAPAARRAARRRSSSCCRRQVGSFGDAELDRRAYRHAVLHQAGYELFGTRAFDVGAFLAAHADRPALPAVFAAMEERRVDATVAARFPGRGRRRRPGPLARPARRRPRSSTVLDRRGDLHRWTVEQIAAAGAGAVPGRRAGRERRPRAGAGRPRRTAPTPRARRRGRRRSGRRRRRAAQHPRLRRRHRRGARRRRGRPARSATATCPEVAPPRAPAATDGDERAAGGAGATTAGSRPAQAARAQLAVRRVGHARPALPDGLVPGERAPAARRRPRVHRRRAPPPRRAHPPGAPPVRQDHPADVAADAPRARRCRARPRRGRRRDGRPARRDGRRRAPPRAPGARHPRGRPPCSCWT